MIQSVVSAARERLEAVDELSEYYRLRGTTVPVSVEQIVDQFRLGLDKIMGEASLYAPRLAALAYKQCEGDCYQAVILLRAYRATLERRYHSDVIDVENMHILRRISSSFKEIPGGQILGPTRDYTQRLLDARIAEEDTAEARRAFLDEWHKRLEGATLEPVRQFSRVSDILVREGIMKPVMDDDRSVTDITREPLLFPANRSATLQSLARAETGGLLTFGYAGMRGFGGAHGAVNELRVGRVAVVVTDGRGNKRYVGRLTVTEAAMSGGKRSQGGKKRTRPSMQIGYGLCFGQNETKAICMGMLDNGMRGKETGQAHKELVLYHTEAADAAGFIHHLKMPHYASSQARLQRVRNAVGRMRGMRAVRGIAPVKPRHEQVEMSDMPELE